MLLASKEQQEIDGSGHSHGGHMSQEGVIILQHVIFQYILFHPFKSMSNCGKTL